MPQTRSPQSGHGLLGILNFVVYNFRKETPQIVEDFLVSRFWQPLCVLMVTRVTLSLHQGGRHEAFVRGEVPPVPWWIRAYHHILLGPRNCFEVLSIQASSVVVPVPHIRGCLNTEIQMDECKHSRRPAEGLQACLLGRLCENKLGSHSSGSNYMRWILSILRRCGRFVRRPLLGIL